MQLNSERFRQDEFNGEPAQRTRVREHRRIQKNSLVSSFMNNAIPHCLQRLAKHYCVDSTKHLRCHSRTPMSFPRRRESSRIYVMLNLFQHLLVDPEINSG
nr:palindromic element RPE3 domain-containing protein [Rickettsia endosymbiont of Ceutorhynchus assimilis]